LTRQPIAAALGLLSALACAHAPNPPGANPEAFEQAALRGNAEAVLARLRPCYQRERTLDPDIEQHMSFLLYVMPSGVVEDVTLMDAGVAGEAPRPSQLNQAIAECAGAEIMRWRFPATTWHGEVWVNQPPIFGARFMPKPEKTEKQAIREVLQKHNSEAAGCYDDYLDRNPAAGDVTIRVQFTILTTGNVSDASIVQPAPPDDRFYTCLLNVVRAARFSASPNRLPRTVSYPFRFTVGR
jgi:TonB family protein